MELKDFIRTTLTELAHGIGEAADELNHRIAVTNTTLRTKGHGDYGLVDFDLAVEVKDTKAAGGKGGIKIAVAQASLGKTSESSASSTSRIKFTLQADFDSQRMPKQQA